MPFELKISSIEEFRAFLDIIRNPDKDKELEDVTKDLDEASEALKEAVDSQKEG